MTTMRLSEIYCVRKLNPELRNISDILVWKYPAIIAQITSAKQTLQKESSNKTLVRARVGIIVFSHRDAHRMIVDITR